MKIVKVCCRCKIQFMSCAFSKDKNSKDGLQLQCKYCYKAYRAINKDKFKGYSRNYYEANKDKISERHKSYVKINPAKANAKSAKRRAAKLNATPNWLTSEDFKQIEAFYYQAQQLTLSTGIQHQVDHIYPLQSTKVCGLHVPSNLQVITAAENSSKSNKILDLD